MIVRPVMGVFLSVEAAIKFAATFKRGLFIFPVFDLPESMWAVDKTHSFPRFEGDWVMEVVGQ